MAIGSLERLAVVTAFGLAAGTAAAAVPPATLSWVQQTGTALNSTVVDVWVRLSVDSSATEPLFLDGSQTVDLPPDWMSVSVQQSASAACSTTFFPQPPQAVCYDPASAYVFSFHYGSDSFLDPQAAILPGESRDFFFGSFVPQNGPVAPGLYSFANASLLFSVEAVDGNGDPQSLSYTIADTCVSYADNCAFTRNVIAVPEPGTTALLAGGLMAIGWRLRHAARRMRA